MALSARGVQFLEAPRHEPYATVAVFRDAALERERLERQADEQRMLVEEQRRQAEEEHRRNEEERLQHAEQEQRSAREQASVIESLAGGMRNLSEGDLVVRLDAEAFGTYRQGFSPCMVLNCTTRPMRYSGGRWTLLR